MQEVILVDDHPLLLETLTMYLSERMPQARVKALSTLEALEEHLGNSTDPALVVLDYSMPGVDGADAIRGLIDRHRHARFAIMSGRATREEVLECLQVGACGFLAKGDSGDKFLRGLEAMRQGQFHLPPGLFEQAPSSRVHVTSREMEVLNHVRAGRSNKAIARDLGIEEVTVKVHISSLLRKYGAKNRTALALRSLEDLVFRG